MDKEDLRAILTNETFCVNENDDSNGNGNSQPEMWIKVCPEPLSHVHKIDATTIGILSAGLVVFCVIVAILVYLFNDRLKKKYIVLAKKWKIPVATYAQVSYLRNVNRCDVAYNNSNNNYVRVTPTAMNQRCIIDTDLRRRVSTNFVLKKNCFILKSKQLLFVFNFLTGCSKITSFSWEQIRWRHTQIIVYWINLKF